MYLKFTKRTYKDKTYRQALIVKGYRTEKGTVSQKTIQNIGPIKTIEDEKKAWKTLKKLKDGEILVSLKETNAKTQEYGVRLLVKHIWDSLNIESLLRTNKVRYDLNQLIYMLITHRLHKFGSENISELEGYRWIKEEAYHTMQKVELQYCYRSLFILLKKKEVIEKHLCNTLHKKKEIVFYDLTSSYVEGEYKKSNLVWYGFNRDKKKGKKQIVLGLLLANNLPLAHKVWEGNKQDKSTLKEAIIQLKDLGIRRFIFVADRGIITAENIEWLEEHKLEYIIATKRRKNKLVEKLISKPIKENVKKVYHDKKKGRAYYLCYNEEVAQEQLKELKERKKRLIKEIKTIKNPTEHRVLSKLGKGKKYFTFTFGKEFSYILNRKVWNYEKKIAGKFLLVTNNKKLGKEKILETYKQLMEIERCFRQLKHFEDMRPHFHKTDKGLKAHIFLCVLAFLIEKRINQEIPDMTTREVITQIKQIKLALSKNFLVRTDITKQQESILKSLNIPIPSKII
jgi:transposase